MIAIKELGELIFVAVVAHAIITAAGRIGASVVYGIVTNINRSE